MKITNYKITKSFWLVSLIAIITLTITSCTPSEQYTDAIVGKWELVLTDEFKLEPGFIWEFNEDLTYSIVNNAGTFETDPFESTPFRAEGTFTGQYLVDAPKGMSMREMYRAPMYFSALEISEDGSSMEMQFTPITPREESESEYILIKFKRTK